MSANRQPGEAANQEVSSALAVAAAVVDEAAVSSEPLTLMYTDDEVIQYVTSVDLSYYNQQPAAAATAPQQQQQLRSVSCLCL